MNVIAAPPSPSRFLSLRWRLAGVSLLLMVTSFAVIGTIQYFALRSYLLDRTALSTASAVKQATSTPNGVPELGSNMALYDLSGHLVQRPQDKPGSTFTWVEPPVAAILSGRAGTPEGVQASGYEVLHGPRGDVLLTTYALPGQGGVLAVELPLDDVNAILARDLAVFVLAAAIALALATAGGLWLTAGALRQLKVVAQVASDVSSGHLHRRTGIHGHDEVGQVAIAFDEMVSRLEHQIDRERSLHVEMRRFLADASHELRTPTAGILGHVEVLQRGAKRNRADLDRSLVAIRAAATRMARLISDLLAITRAEQIEHSQRIESLDVNRLMQRVVGIARPRLGDHPLQLRQVDASVLQGDSESIERMLLNLLDNAAKYSPPGSLIEVDARGVDGWIYLSISDRGCGIPLNERERVFDRFYRGNHGRRNVADGFGLGLAICRALARSQGGDISITDRDEGGSTFVLRLPAVSRA
jgi:two-component system OmpR family sensor kinase